MRAFIFVNGPFAPGGLAPLQIASDDLIIGVDAGAMLCDQLGLVPDVLLGDFDSIPAELLDRYRCRGVAIQQHPARKNATDLELALDLAMTRRADSAAIIGALGGRWDMSFGNILTAASAKYQHMDIVLHAQRTMIHILRAKKQYSLPGVAGTTFSLLPLGGDVSQVTMTGCDYPLTSHDIAFGSSLGLSNIFSEERLTISFTSGILAIVCEEVQLTDS